MRSMKEGYFTTKKAKENTTQRTRPTKSSGQAQRLKKLCVLCAVFNSVPLCVTAFQLIFNEAQNPKSFANKFAVFYQNKLKMNSLCFLVFLPHPPIRARTKKPSAGAEGWYMKDNRSGDD